MAVRHAGGRPALVYEEGEWTKPANSEGERGDRTDRMTITSRGLSWVA
jgi:hypothetical protein